MKQTWNGRYIFVSPWLFAMQNIFALIRLNSDMQKCTSRGSLTNVHWQVYNPHKNSFHNREFPKTWPTFGKTRSSKWSKSEFSELWLLNRTWYHQNPQGNLFTPPFGQTLLQFLQLWLYVDLISCGYFTRYSQGQLTTFF